MNQFKSYFGVLFFLLPSLFSAGQKKDIFPATNVTVLHFNYSLQFPGRDLADRFGVNSCLGTGAFYKFKSNWLAGAELSYMFGGDVKENNILDSLVTTSGMIINHDGSFASIRLQERGYSTFLYGGKIFPVRPGNENSGIMVTLGAGFLQHKIRIGVSETNVPQLHGDYRKGYDRLTNGLALKQFVGYQYLDPDLRLNFFAGVEFIQAFTQNRRSWNFDTRQRDSRERQDFLFAFKAGVNLPLYPKKSSETREFYFD